MTVENEDRCFTILARAKRLACNLAVFKVGESFRTCRAAGELFDRAFGSPAVFVGVYTPDCDPAWLFDDLEYISRAKNNPTTRSHT
jgi:hypothetical protein